MTLSLFSLDATKDDGRLGRTMNHSKKNPNMEPKILVVDEKPRMFLVASTNINPGTELVWDYGDRNKLSLKTFIWLGD